MNELFLRAITSLLLVSGGVAAFTLVSAPYVTALLLSILCYVLAVEWPQFKRWWLTPWYPVLPFFALIDLYLRAPLLWAWLLIVVASYDTGGYLIGRRFGKNTIAPRISPGKTWQGLCGGLLFAAISGVGAGSILLKTDSYGTLPLCLWAVGIAFLALLGDFFESYLKRLAHLKDAGTLLPGHGGVLDRIDGLLLAALVVDSVTHIFG